MANEKKEFNGHCPECGSEKLEMIAGTWISIIYDVQFDGNELIDYELSYLGDFLKSRKIFKDSHSFRCPKCGFNWNCYTDKCQYDIDTDLLDFIDLERMYPELWKEGK